MTANSPLHGKEEGAGLVAAAPESRLKKQSKRRLAHRRLFVHTGRQCRFPIIQGPDTHLEALPAVLRAEP